jgi:hypothetical protein
MARIGGHKKASTEKILKQGEAKMKGQMRKSTTLGLMTFLAIATIAFTANAQGRDNGTLIGAWDQTITFRDCTTGAALRTRAGLISFMFGGVMQEFGTGQQIPQNRTDGQGNWAHDIARTYTAVSKAFRFNADGSVAGTAKLYRQIELSTDGDTFNAIVSSEIYDANGVLVGTGCATEIGTRIR